jgi:3-deoxy-D-arabino-heptulosonate 7-phosphate (DAHP) synthase class II
MKFDGLQPDAAEVQRLLNDLPKLLNESEMAKLRELAASIAEAQGVAFAVVCGAADRYGGTDAQRVMNAREAGMYWFFTVGLPQMIEELKRANDPAS